MCKNVTDEGVIFISTTLQALQQISLSRCTKITDASIVPLAINLSDSTSSFKCVVIYLFCISGLLSIDLTLCSKVTNMSTIAIAEHCTNLTKLDISECGSINGICLPPSTAHIFPSSHSFLCMVPS